jgi:CRP-like cAMP-binding protein
MENEAIKYITKYIDLTPEEIDTVIEFDLIKKFKKDTILLEEGAICNACFLVLEGCIRSYYLINGEEKTTDFYLENQISMPVSYHTQVPSEYFISCLEDSIICVGSMEITKELLKKIPKLEAIGHHLNSDQALTNKIAYDTYKTQTPEQRYSDLQKNRPELIMRVSQYHIASYLGIKPETLSRIRKRIITR